MKSLLAALTVLSLHLIYRDINTSFRDVDFFNYLFLIG